MIVKSFVSSTRADLKTDCIPLVLDAIRDNSGIPITMELWDTSYEDPVEVCRRKIVEESTHYIGIFAYRRGWVPPQFAAQKRSVTEFEFDTALGVIPRERIVVFLPEAGSVFAEELRKRAADQDSDDAAAQIEFQKRVAKEGSVQHFKSDAELAYRVGRRVYLWQNGGLRGAAAQDEDSATAIRFSEGEIINLGRRRQTAQFEETLEMLMIPNAPNVVGFLVSGASGFGHKQMMLRLRGAFISSTPISVKPVAASVGVSWRENTFERLVEVLNRSLDPDTQETDIAALKRALCQTLENEHVLLEISNLHRFQDGIAGFIRAFNTQIAAEMQGAKHRLIVVCSHEGEIDAANAELLQKPLTAEDDDPTFQPGKFVRLAALTKFNANELASWLHQHAKLPMNEATTWATALIDETNDGLPSLVYTKLREEFELSRQ